ncbi:MAG TPA: carboxylesterase family protein, partial [Phycisphaerae bacterium]|nr:carboxylesterase family protein [Phycisphaerae bacterium]
MKFSNDEGVSRRRFLRYGAAGVAAALVVPRVGKSAADEPPIARTTAGQIRGREEGGVFVFMGVPYGRDTATTRFAAPRPPEPWTGVRDCLTWGPRTIQPAPAAPASRPATASRAATGSRPATASRPTGTQAGAGGAARDRGYYMPPDLGGESEDCLNLNVWTRGMRDGGKRPVMVYFHGGAYTYGTSNSVLYDGARLTQRGDVVVVTVNGRLNAFGFLYLAELGEGFADSGMAGQLDLVLALQWVRENIAEFGGDPDRVLIFGQSGGGGKCAALMAMPPAKGLFHRVVCMSGQLIAGAPAE